MADFEITDTELLLFLGAGLFGFPRMSPTDLLSAIGEVQPAPLPAESQRQDSKDRAKKTTQKMGNRN
jgi:hypothetical protein